MDKQDIEKILANGEHITLECKASQGGLPNSVWETYSAFANTYGGVILLGVREDLGEKDWKKRFSICGVDDATKIIKDLWNMLNNKQKVNLNLLHDDDVTPVDIDGKTLVVINVPRADCQLRPIYINDNMSKGTFRRNNEGDYHCTNQELRMMLRDSNEAGNDNMFLEYYTMDDIDIPTLEKYRMRFRIDHPDHVWNDLSHKDFLMQLGGYVINRKEHTEGLTMAGLLMFGKGLPIRERFYNLRMDYIDKSNLIGDQRYSDRLTYDGTWENNLYNFIQIVLPRLTRELPRPFQMEGVVRKDDTPQHKAVREAFTNCIIHADFLLEGLLRIVKYDDRFEFTNPGLLKLPIERIYAGGESKARNQRMQALLRMIGFGEGLGSGFPLILSAWKEKRWTQPELIEEPDLMQVKLILRVSSRGDNTEKVASGTNASENTSKEKKFPYDFPYDLPYEITERKAKIISIVSQEPHVQTEELAQRLSVTRRTITEDIKSLRELGIVSRKGRKKDGIWVVNLNNDNTQQ